MADIRATFDALLSKLENVQQQPSGEYYARCPLCDEPGQQHLAVKIGDRAIVLKCHHKQGCTFEAIAAKLGYRKGELSANGRTPTGQRAKIAATYDYTDEHGTLLHQTVRYEPGFKGDAKSFRQRRPDGKGGWAWDLKCRRVLYRLGEVIAAEPGQVVFVCEGEKSADAIQDLGAIATCNPMGADVWSDDYTAALAGKSVVILPDNDDAGKKHAHRVAQELYGRAETVRILMLPDLAYHAKHGDDPYDWVQRGGDLAALLELVDDTVAFAPTGATWADKAKMLEALAEAPKADQPQERGRPKAPRLMTREYIGLFRKWGYTLRLNQCNDDLEVNGATLDDITEHQMLTQVRDHGIVNRVSVNVQHAREAMSVQAAANAYHPVKDYLEALQWDGKDHIGTLVRHFRDAPGCEGRFLTWFGHWIIGAVAKVYGAWQNPMLVIDGPQEIGKSYFAAWLCPLPRLFHAGAIYPENKDCKLRVIDTWLWEVEELGATTKHADLEALKAFLSMGQVRDRKPYGHRDIVKPALASFLGTINADAGFLVDRTGNRRFLVSSIDKIDWAYADDIDVAQVWAEAVALYRQGDAWKLTDADRKDRDAANEDYMIDDPVEAILSEALEYTGDPGDRVTLPELLALLRDKCTVSQRSQTMTISGVLRKWGATKRRETVKAKRMTVYYGIKSDI